MCGLIGVIPAVASTQMPALVPVLFDIIMALVFLTTAIVRTDSIFFPPSQSIFHQDISSLSPSSHRFSPQHSSHLKNLNLLT